MRTIETKVFKFEELTEAAKAVAIEHMRQLLDYPWGHESRQSLDEFCNLFPVNASMWAIDQESYFMRSVFTGEDDLGSLSGARLYSHIVNHYGHILVKSKTYTLNGKTRKSKIQKVSIDCPFTGYCIDEDLIQPLREFLKKPDGRTFAELLDNCLQSWAKAYSNDIRHYFSDESMQDTIIANEYEFYENGEHYS